MIGSNIDEGGMLIREGGSFYLRCDRGGRYLLELHHMPVNLVGKRVKLTGRLIGPDLVDVDDVAAS